MNRNAEILSVLVEEDFGVKSFGQRYNRSIEHNSLVIDKDRGLFFWNSEGIVGDPLIYLVKVRNFTFDRAKEYLRSFGYSGTFTYSVQANGEDVVVYPELVNVFFDLGLDKRDYFYSRGLTDYTINRFQLGWYNGFNVVPIFENNTFKNFQMRRDNPKTIRPYYKGVGGLLFNSDILPLVDTVYIVEGPIDAIALAQNNLPAISTTVSGTIFPWWFHKFVGQKRIYLVMDNDDAGRKYCKNMANILGVTRCKVYSFEDFDEKGYDPVDYFRDGHTGEEFEELIKEKSKFIFE